MPTVHLLGHIMQICYKRNCLFVLMLYIPVDNFSVMFGRFPVFQAGLNQ